MREPLGPDQIPDDTGAGGLVGWIGEDLLRGLVLRVAALLCCAAVVAGLLSESATEPLKAACVVVGAAGVVLLLVAGLFRWRRSRQWTLLGLLVAADGGLLLAVFLGSR